MSTRMIHGNTKESI